MWHATCTHVIQGDSIFLMVGNQIDTLILGLSFGHNVYCKHSNGSCETINIYVSRAFQCYNEIFNPMSFDPSNYSLNIRKFIGTPTPKVRIHLGMCGVIPSHSLVLLGV
jgi:hypothetical protein